MFTRLALVVAVMLAAPLGVAADQTSAKVQGLREVGRAYEALVDIAKRCASLRCATRDAASEAALRAEAVAVVNDLNDPECLLRLAVVSYASAFPQRAGMEDVDLIFDLAWGASVKRLGDSKSSAALAALKSMDALLETDAGDSLILSETIEKLELALVKK